MTNNTEVQTETSTETFIESTVAVHEQPNLLVSLLENNQLNVENLIIGTFKACSESFAGFQDVCSSADSYSHLFNKNLLYIPVSREADVPVSAKIIQEEFITTLAQVRHAFFCLLANAINVEDPTQTETLSLTLTMDFKDTIDTFTSKTFPKGFIAFEPTQECAFYAIPVLDLFRDVIFTHSPMSWENLDEMELYERSFNS